MRRKQTIAVAVLALALASPLTAQNERRPERDDQDVVRLAGRHMIGFSVGFMDHISSIVSVRAGGVGVSVDSRGAAFVGYGHWFEADYALLAEVGVLSSRVRVSGAGTETATVLPVLFGVRYQPEGWAIGETVRPYLEMSAGPYVGFHTVTGSFVDVGSQSAVGARAGVGLDIIPGRRVSFGAVARYHAVGDFDRAVGSRDNYSGFEFSLRLGILMGRSRTPTAR